MATKMKVIKASFSISAYENHPSQSHKRNAQPHFSSRSHQVSAPTGCMYDGVSDELMSRGHQAKNVEKPRLWLNILHDMPLLELAYHLTLPCLCLGK